MQVNVAMVLKTLKANGDKAKQLILSVVPIIASEDWTEILRQNKVKVVQHVPLLKLHTCTLFFCMSVLSADHM